MSAVINAGERDFDSTLANRQTPLLVDFSASWCGPCKAVAPALESFAERRRNEIAVVKLDIDEAPGIAAKHSIRSVPTLMLFKDGKPLAMQAGMMSETQLAQFVRPASTAQGTSCRGAGSDATADRARLVSGANRTMTEQAKSLDCLRAAMGREMAYLIARATWTATSRPPKTWSARRRDATARRGEDELGRWVEHADA
jgi:thioredoxin 1